MLQDLDTTGTHPGNPGWNLFIDDIRNTDYVDDGREYVLARSVKEAKALIESRGFPSHIAFDHDLGWDELVPLPGSCIIAAPNVIAPSGYDLARWLVECSLDGIRLFPENFTWSVHSSNPVGRDNINGLLSGYLRTTKIN